MNQISESKAAIQNNTDKIKENADDINENTIQIEKNEVRLIIKIIKRLESTGGAVT